MLYLYYADPISEFFTKELVLTEEKTCLGRQTLQYKLQYKLEALNCRIPWNFCSNKNTTDEMLKGNRKRGWVEVGSKNNVVREYKIVVREWGGQAIFLGAKFGVSNKKLNNEDK
jgi:hypothetical protein